MLSVLEGIDGCGKGMVARFMIETLQQSKGPVFDVVHFAKEHKRLPAFEEFKNHTLLLTGEPTYAWVGSAIREEMIKNTRSALYSPYTVAEAFAMDRLVHYKRIVLPALEAGCTVVQERGVGSSLAYQSLTAPDLTMDVIAALEGNAFQLAHPPDVLMVLNLSADLAVKRLSLRTDKKDDSIYEKRDFLERLAKNYASGQFRAFFENNHTRIVDFSTADELGIMKENAERLTLQLLS